MACLCTHSKTRHSDDQGGRCTAMGVRAGTKCFCLTFVSELANERKIRLSPEG